jgi:hypothetical protein
MTLNELFDMLDLERDGELSRAELHEAAQRLGWHWHEAPLFAVLDLFTVREPLGKDAFLSIMNIMAQDPRGPYGEVLVRAHCLLPPAASGRDRVKPVQVRQKGRAGTSETVYEDPVPVLEREAGEMAAHAYEGLLHELGVRKISMGRGALIIIDPQRSFTGGAWMRSIGARARSDVVPIRLAFRNCGLLLGEHCGAIETMFTRCPFPPDSYGWDDTVVKTVPETQPYFIKPGNSVLFPGTNGFREWVESCIKKGENVLVMGGCTLNSCVRVSAIETQALFEKTGLQVVVDLGLSGARTCNFIPSSMFRGLSSVESAVREMEKAGVKVVRRVVWE